VPTVKRLSLQEDFRVVQGSKVLFEHVNTTMLLRDEVVYSQVNLLPD